MWQNDDAEQLFAHLRDLRRKNSSSRPRGGCRSCSRLRSTILVDGAYRVVYSQPCLACQGGGASEKADTPA
ncbi:hypothetical protein GCM10017750_09470 [Streptomyces racemochromogenes]